MTDVDGGTRSFFVDLDDAEVPSEFLRVFERVENLKCVICLLKGWDEEVAASKDSTVKSLSNARRNIVKIRSIIQAIQENIECLQEERNFAKYQQQKLLYILNNIPDRFNCLVPTQKKGDNNLASVTSSEPSTKEHPSTEQPLRNKTVCNIPEVLFLTLDEFEKTPKYLRGRVTYEKINGFIEVFNKVLTSKYAVFKKKKSTLKKKDADLWNAYFKQELKETKGLYFCVADDFKNLNGCVLDKASLNMLTILRHCGRIRELRTGGILRYVAVF
ncbi:spindle and kinetochore-associated protein 1-like [Frankliniella occidentalis]|uniref:SKA complex subunit 1 n=1 Tax=Frankliniella occidentalis TaxID=133901 RepID=A0A6J1T687_FRAOC|nr:spindle and kinetochore-associated protein 1-like [Frankliniella occidentalis]